MSGIEGRGADSRLMQMFVLVPHQHMQPSSGPLLDIADIIFDSNLSNICQKMTLVCWSGV